MKKAKLLKSKLDYCNSWPSSEIFSFNKPEDVNENLIVQKYHKVVQVSCKSAKSSERP